MKHIYVSPHSDDVALSCGGQILANHNRAVDTLILNIFTSDAVPGEAANDDARFRDAIRADRTSEDRRAWASVGVEAEYAALPEAVLRGAFPFPPGGNADPSLVGRIADVLASRFTTERDAIVYVPAGIGGHIDHIACRQAAFRLLDERVVDRIRLYEDVPYAWLRFIRNRHYRALLRELRVECPQRSRLYDAAGETTRSYLRGKAVPFPRGRKLFLFVAGATILRSVLAPRAHGGISYRAQVIERHLDDTIVREKTELLLTYRSQLPMLFGDDPARVLRKHHGALAREVTMELSRAE